MARKREQTDSPRVRTQEACVVPVIRQKELFLPEFQQPRADTRRLAIALDLGTRTGFSATLVDTTQPLDWSKVSIFQGQLDLSLNHYETRAVHPLRLRGFLESIHPDIVFVEDVKYTAQKEFGSVAAACARVYNTAEFFGGLKQAIGDWGEITGTPVLYFPIGRIKQRATGSGRANKLDIIRAHNKEFGTAFPEDEKAAAAAGADNVADSGFILALGLEENWHGLLATSKAEIIVNNRLVQNADRTVNRRRE